jgi:uncharacterized protein (TIGR02757 family)
MWFNPGVNLQIKSLLDLAYTDFHSTYHREKDPVSLVHRFSDPRDQEVAAFLAALLSYGNVQTILGSVRHLFRIVGEGPFQNLLSWETKGDAPAKGLNSFRHRFTTGEDLEVILHWLSSALGSHGSLESFFCDTPYPLSSPVRDLLSDFVHRFSAQSLPIGLDEKRQRRRQSLKYLLSDPERGSACKRLNMFLRWVVRPKDGIDLGLWKMLSPAQLVLPVDTHLLRTLRALRWTRSKQATWKVTEEATRRLRQYSPEDPVRYDFALCHLSMSGENIRRYKKCEAWNATVE